MFASVELSAATIHWTVATCFSNLPQRKVAVYGDLLAVAEALLAFVKTCKGRTNKENAKLASQIRNLIEKWK